MSAHPLHPRSRALATALAALLVAAPLPLAAAPAPDPAPTPPPATPTSSPTQVVVDGSEVGIMSQAALQEIAKSATAEAALHGIEPGQMRVTLVVIDHLEALRGVRVAIQTPILTLPAEDGDPRGPLVAQCPACNEDSLKTASIEGVLEALTRYEDRRAKLEAAQAAQAARSSETEPPPLAPPAGSDEDDEPRRSRPPLGPLGWAGIATLGVGVVGLVTGVTLVAVGKRPLKVETGKALLRNYAKPGYALLAVGGALALGGAIMLGVERRRARRRAPTAWLVPTPTGLTLAGRF